MSGFDLQTGLIRFATSVDPLGQAQWLERNLFVNHFAGSARSDKADQIAVKISEINTNGKMVHILLRSNIVFL